MEKYAKLLALFQACGKIHSRIKVQKMVYALKSLGFPITEGYEYRQYGPYSEELASELRTSVNVLFLDEDLIEGQWEEDEEDMTYQRYDLSITDRGTKFLNKELDQNSELRRVTTPMAQLATELNRLSPRMLELVATLMFIEDQKGRPDFVVSVLKSLKPQFDNNEEIAKAQSIIKDLRARYSAISRA